MRLAHSYDHASSIGFNLRDPERAQWLDRGIAAFARRARASRFEHDPALPKSQQPTLVDVAQEMLKLAGLGAGALWRYRLRRMDRSAVQSVVSRVPELSEVTATFIVEMLEANRRRLLDER